MKITKYHQEKEYLLHQIRLLEQNIGNSRNHSQNELILKLNQLREKLGQLEDPL